MSIRYVRLPLATTVKYTILYTFLFTAPLASQQIYHARKISAVISRGMDAIGQGLDSVGERLDRVGEKLDRVGEKVDAIGEKVATKDDMRWFVEEMARRHSCFEEGKGGKGAKDG